MNNQEPIRDARTLGTPKMLILGLQHMFAMFGATILVPILVNQYGLPLNIQTTLFFAGVGTLFFHVCSRMKVPAFLGSSFAFLGGFSTFYGPVIGAVLIPVASSCVGFLANFPAFSGISRWQMVVVYVLMLFAILLKPEGLFGKKTIKKV